MANHTHDDSEFDAYLHGQSPLSTLYQQTTTTGPATAIDTAILAAAQAAVKKRGGPASPFSYRWMVPTSLAAVIVLSVTVVLLSNHEQDVLLPLPAPAPATAKSEPPAEIMAEDLRAKQAPAGQPQEKATRKDAIKDADKLKTKRAEPVTTLQQQPAAPASALVAAAPESPEKIAEKPLAQGYATTSGSGALEKRQANMQEESSGSRVTESVKKLKMESKLSEATNLGAVVTKSAETWLNEITLLLKAGKETLARDELKAFRKTYASFTIDARVYPEVSKLNTLLEQEKHSE
jgi:hypothetical protein